MTQWTAFAGITAVVLVLLLVLSHLTQSAVNDADDAAIDSRTGSGTGTGTDAETGTDRDSGGWFTPGEDADDAPDGPESIDPGSTGADRSSTDSPSRSAAADAPESPPDESRVHRDAGESPTPDRTPGPDAPTAPPAETGRDPVDADQVDRSREVDRRRDRSVDPDSLSTGMLLANVAASQGLFALVLIGAAIAMGIPAGALGIDLSQAYLETGIRLGVICGLGLYVANEVGAAAATRFGFDHDERLRELLAPDSIRGWLVLLFVVLPIIAVFEELLFRAALIGVLSTGFGLSPWLLAIGSSIAFALGHGMQGTIGIVVTGVLGFVLAAVFVVTGSLLVVVVAHYLINALEFAVHEGLGFEWARILES